MADVTIYSKHRSVLDAFLKSGKTRSVAAEAGSGPFVEQRDVYVFAASIGLALGTDNVPNLSAESRKDATLIRDQTFFGAVGAAELCFAACLAEGVLGDTESISKLLPRLTLREIEEQFSLLDRFAFAGFEWLSRKYAEGFTTGDLMLHACECIRVAKGPEDLVDSGDPILDLLGHQLS